MLGCMDCTQIGVSHRWHATALAMCLVQDAKSTSGSSRAVHLACYAVHETCKGRMTQQPYGAISRGRCKSA